MAALGPYHEQRQPHAEGHEQEMETYGERELQPRQESRIHAAIPRTPPKRRVRSGSCAAWMWKSQRGALQLSLIHISEPTRRTPISYAVFCLKKKKKNKKKKKISVYK